MTGPLPSGSPIRVPPDLRPCAPPRGLSRLAAPFVVSLRQGIRRAPCISCPRLAAGRHAINSVLFHCVDNRGCRDRERWNAPRGTTPLQILKCRCLLSLSDRKDRLKSDGESIFEIVPVPRQGSTLSLPSRYAALKVRGANPGDRVPRGEGQGRNGRARCRAWDPVYRVLISKVIGFLRCLPRKEVIQPHVPVRLPCYDFTPLALHTFDASLTRLGRRLRVQTTRVV